MPKEQLRSEALRSCSATYGRTDATLPRKPDVWRAWGRLNKMRHGWRQPISVDNDE